MKHRPALNFEEAPLLTTYDVAQILGLSPLTLRSWRKRSLRDGPSFIRVGRRIRYSIQDLQRYIRSRTVLVKGRKRTLKPPRLSEKK
jgi:hypothetical protein